MKKINSQKELREEMIKSKMHLDDLEAMIEDEIASWTISGNIKSIVSSKNNGLVSESIGISIDNIVKRILPKRMGWITKFMAAYFLKNYARNILAKNAENIFSWLGKTVFRNNNNHPPIAQVSSGYKAKSL